jgi:hypothetical protein
MKITAIKLARVIALFDTNELTPGGEISLSKFITEATNKFGFQKFPTAKEPAEENNGLVFLNGAWNDTPVLNLTIFNDGIILETNTSTARSIQILRESLHWAKQELRLHFEEEMLRRIRYLSSFGFYSEAPILKHSQPMNNAAKTMSEFMKSILGQNWDYDGSRIDLDFDHSINRAAIAPFTIQRLGVESFDSNRYFSQAPLPTDAHIALVEQFEADVLAL